MSLASLLSVADIEEKLKDQAESLCFKLFPNGRMDGRLFRIGNLAGDSGQSLFVRVDGPKCGNWRDMCGSGPGGRDRGDLLWLVACAMFNGEIAAAVAWAKSWLRLDDLDPARLAQHKLEIQASADRRASEADAQVKRTQASARKRWHMGVPIAGTMAEEYLAARMIDLRRLGRQPGALRFNDAVQYGFGDEAKLLPAMLAAVHSLHPGDVPRGHVATHRTWLARDPDGRVRKAGSAEGVAKPKKVLGPFDGAHIPLWKGACGTMPLRDIPAGTDVWVSEGIEDGLTAASADPSLRVIAGISVGNIGALALPEQMGWLVILAQNDPPGSDADKALARAIAAHRGRGRRVKVARPPQEAAA